MSKKFDIMIVEDEPVVVAAAKKILLAEDLTVDEAFDAETALTKLQENEYRLILSDLMLPKLSGFDLIELVKKSHPGIPVIVITGYATLENAIKSFRLGAFDFIPKPFDIEELLGVVYRGMNLLQLDRTRQTNAQTKSEDHFYALGGHSWARLDSDGSALFGVGRQFADSIDEIVTIDFPQKEEDVSQGKVLLRIHTKDNLLHSVWAPLSGKVVEINQAMQENLELLHEEPFKRGWLVRVIPTNLETELQNLTEVN